jgi:hypothetical protein
MPQAKSTDTTTAPTPGAYEQLAVNSIISLFRAPASQPANDAHPKSTMQVMDELVAAMAPVAIIPNAPRSPYVTSYGKILDPEKHARWVMDMHKAGVL